MKEYNFKINGSDYNVSIDNIDDSKAEVFVNGTPFNVEFEDLHSKPKAQSNAQVVSLPGKQVTSPTSSNVQPRPAVTQAQPETSAASPLKSPLPGVILDIRVNVGDTVKEGDHLMILEAMKMENNIDSNRSGVIQSINVSRGDSVLEGDILLTIG